MGTIPRRYPIPHAWQRRQVLWSDTPWQVLLVAVVCGLGAPQHSGTRGRSAGAAGRASDPAPAQAQAVGLAAFQRGDFEGAAASRQAAARLAAETKQPQAHSLALTHLARAYAALGHDDRGGAEPPHRIASGRGGGRADPAGPYPGSSAPWP